MSTDTSPTVSPTASLTAFQSAGVAPPSETDSTVSPESALLSRPLGGSGLELALDSVEKVRQRTADALRSPLRRQLSEILRNPDVMDALVVARREGWPIKVQVHVDMPEEVLAKIQAQREAEYEAAALAAFEAYNAHLSPDERLQRAKMSREERIADGLAVLAMQAAQRMDAEAASIDNGVPTPRTSQNADFEALQGNVEPNAPETA